MNEDLLRNQINSLIRDEIQEVINDYVDGLRTIRKKRSPDLFRVKTIKN